MVSSNSERNGERKCSGGAPSRMEPFFSRFFSSSRPCCCRGCALKSSGKNCPAGYQGKQARPNSMGNASTNCMD
ncbi:hypothetical protein CXT95_02940 [Akkermansia muciniphila]|uniref:Uncharacterized protein n=1 Tax=Akkermansia muciniphila TaxID=239935 RepID=A0AAX0WM24_9BACT|nr:hypothetical protein CXT95_02940 [Akkermansia muciniphila]